MKISSRFSPARRALLLGAAALSLGLMGCSPTPPEPLPFDGTDITGTHLGKDLSMTDTDGHLRTLEDYRGKVVMVFFGYTQCPDVCPTSMAMAAQAMQLLGPQASDVQVLMVSVDPARDTPEILSHYVHAFDPSFIGLTGTPEQLAATARSFKTHYSKEDETAPGQYAMSHSSAFYLLDKTGEARVLLSANTTPQLMAHDIKLLL